jgi:DNA primase
MTDIDEIKSRIDIADFIGKRVVLKKAGRNFKGNCPFHNEKTPSFVVSPDRQIWRCFGACQDGGDVIAFLMKLENITFFEALKELAHQSGVTIKNLDFEDKAWNEKEKLIKINDAAAKMYHYLLLEHSSGEHAREYLEERGINKGLIETFQLGYAPQSWDSLFTYLKKKNFDENDIINSGLALHGKTGRPYDRFRGRLMFPIVSTRNTILGFSGRLLHDNEKQAKYVNTPETLLYHKRETLYGVHVAKESIISEKSAIVVEGEFDMISCYKHGIKNVVAVKGSAVTRDQLALLKRFTQHLILALDADFSGAETTKRAIQDAEELEFRIDIIRSNIGKDPDEALKKDAIAFKKLIKKPIPIYDFIIDTAIAKHSIGDPYEKSETIKEIIPFIEYISNPIVFSHYAKLISEKLGIHENDVVKLVDDYRRKKQVNVHFAKTVSTPEIMSRVDLLQKYILAALLQNNEPLVAFSDVSGIISEKNFSLPAYQDIFAHFKKFELKNKDKKDHDFNIKKFVNNLSNPLQQVFDEIFLFDISQDTMNNKNFLKMAYELKKYSLKKTISQLMEKNSEDTYISELTKEIAEVEKHLSDM